MPTTKALVLESDPEARGSIVERLKSEGVSTLTCHRRDEIHDMVTRHGVDICFIDVTPGQGDSFAMVRDLRQTTSAGLIALGKSTEEVDIVLALEMGADDYMAKPVRPREMCARARAVLRRTLQMRSTQNTPRPLPDHYLRRIGDLEICAIARSVSFAGETVDLTALEFDVLTALSAQANAVLSRDKIIETVRGSDWSVNHRAVDGIVSRLRRKVFPADTGAKWIKTVHGRGYMLIDPS